MPRGSEPLASLLRGSIDRRRFVLSAACLPFVGALGRGRAPAGFAPLAPSRRDDVEVPDGYRADVVLAWGDPLFEDSPPFDPERQGFEAQARQFGFNNDFNAFLPLGDDPRRGLICVNHEATSPTEMFFDLADGGITRERADVEIAAHGMSIAELRFTPESGWRVRRASRLNRRITAATPIGLSGPAAGSSHLRTKADPEGRRVLGMLSNCSGGKTPWGTILTCEENFHEYFSNAGALEGPEREALDRYALSPGESFRPWARHHERFDAARHPNEANRFGWVVEVDPRDPASAPVKRTALGRFKHEAATTGLAANGRVVVYSGDDGYFEYLYKYVSERPHRAGEPGGDLLDRGTLHVARFAADGTGEWVPMVPGGPLEGWSLARILVHARLAADALGATPMDRPEDVEVNPFNGRVYVALTNNPIREEGDGGPNPRPANLHGHVLELTEKDGDLGARRFTWSLFLACGEEAEISCPDNMTFDPEGNVWLATDGQPSRLGFNDSVYAIPTAGPDRGRPRRFLNGPVHCELCGPEFTPDFRTLFVNVQHPGGGRGLDPPSSTWPHDDFGMPRPALVAVRRADGGTVGD